MVTITARSRDTFYSSPRRIHSRVCAGPKPSSLPGTAGAAWPRGPLAPSSPQPWLISSQKPQHHLAPVND